MTLGLLYTVRLSFEKLHTMGMLLGGSYLELKPEEIRYDLQKILVISVISDT